MKSKIDKFFESDIVLSLIIFLAVLALLRDLVPIGYALTFALIATLIFSTTKSKFVLQLLLIFILSIAAFKLLR